MRMFLRYMICVLTLLSSNTIIAQDSPTDVIITQSGDPIKAYNIEISSKTVFYQLSLDADAPVMKINKDEVLLIKYSNGEKWIPDEAVPGTSAPQPTVQSQSYSYKDDTANSLAFDKANPQKVEYIGKLDDKEATEILLLYAPTSSSILADQNLEITVKSRRTSADLRSLDIDIILTNRSNKILYVDLGNTYLIQDGESLIYYTPGSVSSSNTSMTGTSVGLGTISIGTGNAATTTETKINQRILQIPPGVSKILIGGGFKDFGKVKQTGLDFGRAGGYLNLSLKRSKDKKLKNGDISTDFAGVNFPSVTVMTSYSFDESQSNSVELKASYEADRMIGGHIGKIVDQKIINDQDFSKNYENCLYLFLRQIDKK